MTRRLLAIASFSAPLLLVGCFSSGGDDPPATPTPDKCQLDTQGEGSPGFPFDIAKFRSDVLPIVVTCGSGGAGCHGNPQGQGSFTVWADAATDDCNFGQTFNNVAGKIDLVTPGNSRLLLAPSGGSATHPNLFGETSAQFTTLKAYVDDAVARKGVVTPPVGDANPLDKNVFKTVIQPMLDSTGCSGSTCHGSATGISGLKIIANATAQTDLDANLLSVTGKTDVKNAAGSKIYNKGKTPHGGSTALSAANAAAMLDWITKAGAVPTPPGGGGCAPINKFNLGVFQSEILPILNGSIDYNQDDQQGNGAGCMSTACHGASRGPGTLALIASDPIATTLQNFVCFVDLTSPSASEILACPSNTSGCRVRPHPGQDVLDGADDLNYQKIIGFLFSANADTTPLDFAFFTRQINTIFNDLNAVEDGAQGVTCADTVGCHGASVAGQPPANGSDFAIIPNAGDVATLTFNFVQAASFTNFLNPNQSSLFLYPTNEIANRDNPLATGLPHPGGEDFDVNDAEALAILKWAGGLRPDGNGQGRDWLVAGDFVGADIQDDRVPQTVKPKIFDLTGGAFNGGEWDGFFSNAAVIDLNQVFPRNNTARIAYATTYVVNTESRDIPAQVLVNTQNPVRIYVNGVLAGFNDQGGPANASALLKSAAAKAGPTQILIKLEQRVGDANFAFSAQFLDENSVELTDATKEIVFTLGPNGGI